MPIEESKFLVVPKTQATNSGYKPDFKKGFHQELNLRAVQEDALCMAHLKHTDLIPYGLTMPLSSAEIGHRLWTMHLKSNQNVCDKGFESGSTATSVVYDGKSHIISANLGDSTSFALVFDANGKPISVTRINSMVHNPAEVKEIYRVKAADGYIDNGRLNRILAMTRSIGDNISDLRKEYKGRTPLSSHSCVDMLEIDKLPGVTKDSIVKVMVCSDGFTDAGPRSNKKVAYESYLLYQLRVLSEPGKMAENVLAKSLSMAALGRSKDNISIGIQTIRKDHPFFIGCYDGHGGAEVSTYLANNAIDIFIAFCNMESDKYRSYPLSVQKTPQLFNVDNDPIIRQCNPETYSILYSLDLLYAANIKMLAGRPVDQLEKINEILLMLRKNKLDEPNVFFKLLPRNDYKQLQDAILLLQNYAWMTHDMLHKKLLPHSNIADFLLVISLIKETFWFNKSELEAVLAIDKLSNRSMVMNLLAKQQMLDYTTYQKLKRHAEPEGLEPIFKLAQENEILTERNINIILKVPNITQAIKKITVIKDHKLIIWGGPMLHGLSINESGLEPKDSIARVSVSEYPHRSLLSYRFQKLSGIELNNAILNYFKIQLMETVSLYDLERKVSEIKLTREYHVIAWSGNRNNFYYHSNTPDVLKFNNMVQQQKDILTLIEKQSNLGLPPKI